VVAWFTSQVARPHGFSSGWIATMLNRSNRHAIRRAVDLLSLEDGAVAADLGFGGGLGLALLLDRVGERGQVVGVDVSPEMVRRAERRFQREVAVGRLRLHEASITALPLADASLDGAMTMNTIYYVGELERVMAELARVLKSPGVVVVGISDPGNPVLAPMTAHGYRIRPIDEIVGVAKTAGLELRRHSRVDLSLRAPHLLSFSNS
jgi:arsenite methyltransferase